MGTNQILLQKPSSKLTTNAVDAHSITHLYVLFDKNITREIEKEQERTLSIILVVFQNDQNSNKMHAVQKNGIVFTIYTTENLENNKKKSLSPNKKKKYE